MEVRITYALTVCNELKELQVLYKALSVWKRPQDEILIQQDNTNITTDEAAAVNAFCVELEKSGNIKYITQSLNKDFASFKNNLIKYASGNYIFQIDADEVPCISLIEYLPLILETNPDVDVYVVPRINTVDGLTSQHIANWGWNVNEKNYVNFPDYQFRILKNNGKIKWENKVHEKLVGYNKYAALPPQEEYCLYHPKDIARQEQQNNFYDTI
jgi:glycosyltransferase involved in cell wall biosynthesis